MKIQFSYLFIISALFGAPIFVYATSGGGFGGYDIALTFFWIALILIAAKVSSLVEKIGQPAVLGELVVGIILGNLTLLGIHIFESIIRDNIILFLAELGAVILLFQIGLELDIHKMRSVGVNAFFVAVIGVIIPFVLGAYIVGPWLLPGLETNVYIFLGAALTATSVGITARVFRDLGKLHIREAQIVLGAAVIDDILGLFILAVVSAIVTVGAISPGMVGLIAAKSIIFFVGAIVFGQILASMLGKFFSKIHTGVGMKFTLALSFGLVFAYIADSIGLAPIVGAFAAGIILDPVHFRFFQDPQIVRDIREATRDAEKLTKERVQRAITKYADSHIEDLIEPISYLLVPIFFVVIGMQVKLDVLFEPRIVFIASGVTAVAFIGKIVSGVAAGNVKKSLVGWGMVPRGEVGLIFATIGRSMGVFGDELFSIIVIVVIITTLLPPPILSWLLKRHKEAV